MREAIPSVPKLDQVATGVLILLLIASPIAFGAVHPLIYRPMEALLFGLAIVWMAKIAQVARSANESDRRIQRIRGGKAGASNCRVHCICASAAGPAPAAGDSGTLAADV